MRATARALKVSPRRLETMVHEEEAGAGAKSPFVELEAGAIDVFGGVTIEIDDVHGTAARVRSASAEMAAHVAASLLMVTRP